MRIGVQSGKVHRLTRNPRIYVAPCDYSGKLRADACVGKGEIDANVDALLRRKYGFQKRLFDWLSSLRANETAAVEIHLN